MLAALALRAAERPARSDLIRERLARGAELVVLPASLVDAERIAWRVCKLWLDAQITHINLDQAKPQEVFLPYLVMPNNRTLYETMEDNTFFLPSTAGQP